MSCRLHLLGYPRVERDGEAVEVGVRKALALLAYVALAEGPASRDALAALLWPEAPGGTARASLRRTLYLLQRRVGEGLLEARADTVSLAAGARLWVDVTDFRETLRGAGRLRDASAPIDHDTLERACGLYRGDFLAGFAVPDCPEFEEWRYFLSEDLRRSAAHGFDRLSLAWAAAGDTGRAIEEARRWLALDRLHEPAHRRLMTLYARTGLGAAALDQFATCRRLLREELDVEPEPESEALLEQIRGGLLAPEATLPTAPPPSPAPEDAPVRYVRSGDVHVAYRVFGSGPLTLVLVPGFVCHLDLHWSEESVRAFTERLGRLARVVLFDKRGMGLSDRVAYVPTLDHMAQDLRTVLDAAEVRRVVVVGVSEGGPAAIRFAAAHPERVSGLVLWGTLAKGTRAEGFPWAFPAEGYDAAVEAMVGRWGGPELIDRFAPSWTGDAEKRAWWARTLRLAASPASVRNVLLAMQHVDVRELLPAVACPTLVVHRRDDRAILVGQSRYIAEERLSRRPLLSGGATGSRRRRLPLPGGRGPAPALRHPGPIRSSSPATRTAATWRCVSPSTSPGWCAASR